MIKIENSTGSFSPARVRAPAMGSGSILRLPARQTAAQALISAAQELLLDRYWMCLADPGENPFANKIVYLNNMHILQKHSLELITREFMLLGQIPARKTPDSLALAYVSLLHELLHKAERSGSKDDSLIEGATQYLAIYAYLGEAPKLWVSHPHSDFGHQTGMVAHRVDSFKAFTVFALARAYFGNGDFNSLFKSVESKSPRK
jgi:hypothetical protein